MRILVAYYSRSGHTRAVATRLADALRDSHEVVIAELKPQRPVGFFAGVFRTRAKAATPIVALPTGKFDLVYLGTPIMAGQAHTVTWGYLAAGPVKEPHVVFSTSGGGDNDVKGLKVFADACRAKGVAVKAVIDVKYPAAVEAKLPLLIAAAK